MGACNSYEKNRSLSGSIDDLKKNKIICKECNYEFINCTLST